MGDVAILLFVHFNFIIQFQNMFVFLKSIHIMRHCILSQIYALFIEFYYALFIEFYYALFFFFFLFFKDMHYNTMIRTFCILKTMMFSAFHYLTLSIRCEELDTDIN
jgi:hypothetical protein